MSGKPDIELNGQLSNTDASPLPLVHAPNPKETIQLKPQTNEVNLSEHLYSATNYIRSVPVNVFRPDSLNHKAEIVAE